MDIVNLHIKNMVCSRCEYVIKTELANLGVSVDQIKIGYAKVRIPKGFPFVSIEDKLNEFGFELIKKKEDQIIDKIKVEISSYLTRLENSPCNFMLSDHLAKENGRNYSYLSKLFSNRENKTIEAFYIDAKINRVKELVSYNQLTLSQISIVLGYK